MARPKGSKDSVKRQRRYGDMMSKQEIAAELGINCQTVEKDLQSAIAKLRKVPELLQGIVELVEMRAGMRGESRIIR